MVLLPLVFPAFVVWLQRGRPAKPAVALVAVGLLALSARVPLSGYTVSDFKQDSPFLMGVFRLEKAVGVGDGSLAIALGAAVLACLAVAAAFKERLRLGRRRRDDRRLVRGLARRDLVRPPRRPHRARDLPAARTRAGSTTPTSATRR